MQIKTVMMIVLAVTASFFAILSLAAPNRCDANCVSKLRAAHPGIGKFTSASWQTACPSDEAGLLQGCFMNAAAAAASPIGPIITTMFYSLNTTATSVDSAVYVRKFPAGYIFTAGSGRSYVMNTTGVASPTQVMCVKSGVFLESGLQAVNGIRNNPQAGFGQVESFLETDVLSVGSISNERVLDATPGVGVAQNLNVPVYAVCVGFNSISGGPSSLAGFSAF